MDSLEAAGNSAEANDDSDFNDLKLANEQNDAIELQRFCLVTP